MAYLRPNVPNRPDPFLKFRSCYGYGSQDKEKVPTFEMICDFRETFRISNMKVVDEWVYQKAPGKLGVHIEQFCPKWKLEKNSMLYVVTEKRGNVVTASPVCAEVGLYDEWKHLQKISLNCASADLENQKALTADGWIFSYVHQLYYGDLIVVLDVMFYEPPSNKEHVPKATAVLYYVLQRNIEVSELLVAREGSDFLLFKGVKDVGYPAAGITEEKLRRKLDVNTIPPAHRYTLPDVFLITGTVFIPTKKCFRLGLFFNRNCLGQQLVRDLLRDVALLPRENITNYLPYIPHVQLLTATYSGQLDDRLESTSNEDTMTALKSVRAAKLQTSPSCHSDRRYVLFYTSGASGSPNGDLYVTLKTKAALSMKSYRVGDFVEMDGVWKEPLVATIVSIKLEGVMPATKTMVVYLTHNCGYIKSNDLTAETIINHEESWGEIHKLFQRMTTVTIRCCDQIQSYDILSSSEKVFNATVLGESLIQGMQMAAETINRKGRTHVENQVDHLYFPSELPATTLSSDQLAVFGECLRHTPTPEQIQVLEKIMDDSLEVHVVEAAFGSGKTATAAAAAHARLKILNHSRVALLAQTNSAVEALLESSNFPVDIDFGSLPAVRPLVFHSKNWKMARNRETHRFDYMRMRDNCFYEYLNKTDPRAYFEDQQLLRSIFAQLLCSKHVNVRELPEWKFKALARLRGEMVDDARLFHFFLSLYRPNVFYATVDMFVAFFNSPYIPHQHFPDLILIDESAMISPVDLILFSSKMTNDGAVNPARFVLLGDMKQLEPYNTVRSLAPLNVSPNKLLLQLRYIPSRLTTVYRNHPDAVEVLSKMFYNGVLTSGRSIDVVFLQSALPPHLFPGRHRAFHFVPNTHSSHSVLRSRANPKEADDVVAYVQSLLGCAIQSDSIVVLSPYSAQRDILRQKLPHGVRALTTRQYQGGECDVVVFSACASGYQDQKKSDDDAPADSSRILLRNGITSKVFLISDPSIILVSLSRARHFTTVFGHQDFLRSIPLWRQFFELCNY